MVTIKAAEHFGTHTREARNRMVIVTRPNGDRIRFEFDTDEDNVYVYTGTWPADWPNGRGCKEQLPVRVIPMRNWRA